MSELIANVPEISGSALYKKFEKKKIHTGPKIQQAVYRYLTSHRA